MSDRRVVVIYGDCQAQFLHMLTNAMPSLNERFAIVLVTNDSEPGQPLPPVPPEVAHAAILWEQYNEFSDAGARVAVRALVPDSCVVVRFPGMIMSAFWPFRTKDKRNVSEPGYPWGRYPLGDWVASEVATLGLSPENAFARYMEQSLEKMPDLGGIVEFERRLLGERDRACDVAMSDFFFEHLQTTYQFWSHGNLSTVVYAELIRRLFARSGDALGPAPQGVHADLDDLVVRIPGQGIQVPIHPAVIDRLGLRFVSDRTTYRYFGNEWTFEEYMTRYIAFDRSW